MSTHSIHFVEKQEKYQHFLVTKCALSGVIYSQVPDGSVSLYPLVYQVCVQEQEVSVSV